MIFASEWDITTLFNLDELKHKVPVKKIDVLEIVNHMSMAAVSAIVEQTDTATPKDLRDQLLIMMMYDLGAQLNNMISIKIHHIYAKKQL